MRADHIRDKPTQKFTNICEIFPICCKYFPLYIFGLTNHPSSPSASSAEQHWLIEVPGSDRNVIKKQDVKRILINLQAIDLKQHKR